MARSIYAAALLCLSSTSVSMSAETQPRFVRREIARPSDPVALAVDDGEALVERNSQTDQHPHLTAPSLLSRASHPSDGTGDGDQVHGYGDNSHLHPGQPDTMIDTHPNTMVDTHPNDDHDALAHHQNGDGDQVAGYGENHHTFVGGEYVRPDGQNHGEGTDAADERVVEEHLDHGGGEEHPHHSEGLFHGMDVEQVGCFPRAENDAKDAVIFMDPTCEGYQHESEPCRSGLPFYRRAMNEKESYLDCVGFCAMKGFDLSGIVTSGGSAGGAGGGAGGSDDNGALEHDAGHTAANDEAESDKPPVEDASDKKEDDAKPWLQGVALLELAEAEGNYVGTLLQPHHRVSSVSKNREGWGWGWAQNQDIQEAFAVQSNGTSNQTSNHTTEQHGNHTVEHHANDTAEHHANHTAEHHGNHTAEHHVNDTAEHHANHTAEHHGNHTAEHHGNHTNTNTEENTGEHEWCDEEQIKGLHEVVGTLHEDCQKLFGGAMQAGKAIERTPENEASVCDCYMQVDDETAGQYDCAVVEGQLFTLKGEHFYCKQKAEEAGVVDNHCHGGEQGNEHPCCSNEQMQGLHGVIAKLDHDCQKLFTLAMESGVAIERSPENESAVCTCYMQVDDATADGFDCAAVKNQRFTLKGEHAHCKSLVHEFHEAKRPVATHEAGAECRCGATEANSIAWGSIQPRQALLLRMDHATHGDSDPRCIPVFQFRGQPDFMKAMLMRSEHDAEYIDDILNGGDMHEEEELDKEADNAESGVHGGKPAAVHSSEGGGPGGTTDALLPAGALDGISTGNVAGHTTDALLPPGALHTELHTEGKFSDALVPHETIAEAGLHQALNSPEDAGNGNNVQNAGTDALVLPADVTAIAEDAASHTHEPHEGAAPQSLLAMCQDDPEGTGYTKPDGSAILCDDAWVHEESVCDGHEYSPQMKERCPVTCKVCEKGTFKTCYPNRCAMSLWSTKDLSGKVQINYWFDTESGVDAGRKEVFEAAIEHFMSKPGLCFEFHESEAKPTIRVTGNPHGCSVHGDFIGNHVGSHSEVQLNMGWCNSIGHKGSVIRQIAHALGMSPEQKRPDALHPVETGEGTKGPFLRVHWQNVPSVWTNVFKADATSYMGSGNDGDHDAVKGYAPYDYDSIMHPAVQHGSFETANPAFEYVVGQNNHLSVGDVSQLSDMYQCAAGPPTPEQIAVAVGEDEASAHESAGQDCFASCGHKGGLCDSHCGEGMACCREKPFPDTEDPPECTGAVSLHAEEAGVGEHPNEETAQLLESSETWWTNGERRRFHSCMRPRAVAEA